MDNNELDQLLKNAGRSVPARYESMEGLSRYEDLDGISLLSAIQKNPGLANQLASQLKSGNAFTGGGGGGTTTRAGGALNAKKSIKASFMINISAPYVTIAGVGTAPPDAGFYNIPIFGAQAATGNYTINGILGGPSGLGYAAFAISGANLANGGGAFPAPFAAVPVDPTAWYFLYIKLSGGITQAAMWKVSTNGAYPYTSQLPAWFNTHFRLNRLRFILNNVNEIEQFNCTILKGFSTSFGRFCTDTIDTQIFGSPEQLNNGKYDIDLGIGIKAQDFLTVPSDPVNVPSGFTLGCFVENFGRIDQLVEKGH